MGNPDRSNIPSSHKVQRQERAANQRSSRSNRMQMGCKGRTSNRASACEVNPIALALTEETKEPAAMATTGSMRIAKLQRQLSRLQSKNARTEKLVAKETEIIKAKWRSARVADLGRNSGFKPTSTRASRASAAVMA